MIQQKTFQLATFYGATAVALGAFGAHGLKDILTEQQLISFKTGVLYQFLHSFLLLFVWHLKTQDSGRFLKVITGTIGIGILFFSGSIYLLVSGFFAQGGQPLWLVLMTPTGGLLLLSAWVQLFIYSFLKKGTHDRTSY